MNTALKPIDEFRDNINRMGDQFLAALPKHVDVEKFKRTIVTAVSLTPALLEADRRSLLASAMKAASDGLLPDGREAALVPFKGQVQYLPMVGGLLKRMRQSGDVRSITCEVIYENDRFERWIDEHGEHIRHEPNYRDADRGPMMAAYACVYTNDGGVYVEVMSKAEIEKARAVSKTKDREDGPWRNWEAAMWRKTVLRKVAKTAPVATDVLELIARDDAENNDLGQAQATVTTIKPSRPRTLQAIAGDAPAPEVPAEPEAPQESAREATGQVF